MTGRNDIISLEGHASMSKKYLLNEWYKEINILDQKNPQEKYGKSNNI